MHVVDSLKLIGKEAKLKDGRIGKIKSTLNQMSPKGVTIIGVDIEGIGEIDIKDVLEVN